MKKIYIFIFIAFLFNLRSFSQNCALLCNGDFENPYMTSTSGLTVTLNCWNTTASDGKMEVWGTGYNGVSSYSGIQHVELNATQAAIMYQDFVMYQDFAVSNAGTILNVKFAHRARTNAGMTDSVEVSIGPAGGPYTSLGRYGDGPSQWSYNISPNYVASTTGTYRVRFNPFYYSYGNSGIGNFLDAVSVCSTSQAGINELSGNTFSSIGPNPATENCIIRFENPANTNFTLNLYDYQGKMVKSMDEIYGTEVTLERGDLKSGIYFYELCSSKGNAKGKIAFTD
jgi:hypothetical protein